MPENITATNETGHDILPLPKWGYKTQEPPPGANPAYAGRAMASPNNLFLYIGFEPQLGGVGIGFHNAPNNPKQFKAGSDGN